MHNTCKGETMTENKHTIRLLDGHGIPRNWRGDEILGGLVLFLALATPFLVYLAHVWG